MTHGLTILAAAALALGTEHFLRYLGRNGTRRVQREALHTWEGEGGAVPVTRSTTVAQVPPLAHDGDAALGH